MTRRLLPASVDDEVLVLNRLLIAPDATLDGLTGATFYDRRNAIVFGAIERIRAARGESDVDTVRAALVDDGLLRRAGGAERLHELVVANSSPGAHRQAVARLIELDRQRQLVHLSDDLSKASMSGDRERIEASRLAIAALNGTEAPAAMRARAVNLATVEPEAVEWLWQDYIPLGKLTVLDGDPGLGKSTITLDLAARVTTGKPLPDGTPPGVDASDVVLLTAEDGLADTVRPRLDAAGGNPARLHVLVDIATRIEDRLEYRLPSIPGDVDAVAQLVVAHRARLVVVDVLVAYLDAEINSFRDQDVRRALLPLGRMAEQTGASVLVLRHLNKNPGGAAVYRGGGSIGIAGAARSVLMVGADPDDRARRVLASVKSNLGPTPPSLGYRLVGDALFGCAVVRWDGVVERRADELVADLDGDERSALAEAERFLRDELANGPALASDLMRRARQAGISDRTLKRAKRRLEVESHSTGFQKPYEWSLPAVTNAQGVPRDAIPNHGAPWHTLDESTAASDGQTLQEEKP